MKESRVRDKPTFIIYAYIGGMFGFYEPAETADPAETAEFAGLEEHFEMTEGMVQLEACLENWLDGLINQMHDVFDHIHIKSAPPPPAFDWNKWNLAGLCLAVQLSRLVGPSWIIAYETAMYGPHHGVRLWQSEV